MTCPNCNFTPEQETAFCPQCGEPMPVAPQPNPQPNGGYGQPNYGQQAGPQPQGNYTQQPGPGYQSQPSGQPAPGPATPYCRNCGRPMAPGSVVCLNCGVSAGSGTSYCAHCGCGCDPRAVVCTRCGAPLHGGYPGANQKSKVAAGLLGIFLGWLGVHNFYLGFTSKAVIQLVLTILGIATSCIVIGIFIILGIGIWGLVEGIMILTGSIPADANGVPLRS